MIVDVLRGRRLLHAWPQKAGVLLLITISAAAFSVFLNPYLWTDPAGNAAVMVKHLYLTICAQKITHEPYAIVTLADRADKVFRGGCYLG